MRKQSKPTEESKELFVKSILAKAYSKDSDPTPYKQQVTEESIKKTENLVKKIQEKVK